MSSEALTRLAQEVYAGQQARKPAPPLSAQFYPFASLNHTIRLRNGKILLRISDLMTDAPEPALRAIIGILLLKLDRRKVPAELEAIYRAYARDADMRGKVHQIRKQRGRKLLNSRSGRFFDLGSSFDRLNREYFNGELKVSALTWSRSKTRRILGHYDRCHDTIVISRSLDAEWVSPMLFHYILFHEMLHASMDDQFHNGKRYAHHRDFKTAEKKFKHYREAQKLMKQFSVRIR
ncbi:MAG TPA: SprT-like domain-containing protein [Acidobacteriota bacterium]|jgi:hypothetical protein